MPLSRLYGYIRYLVSSIEVKREIMTNHMIGFSPVKQRDTIAALRSTRQGKTATVGWLAFVYTRTSTLGRDNDNRLSSRFCNHESLNPCLFIPISQLLSTGDYFPTICRVLSEHNDI